MALETRIPVAFEKFNCALDDIECDIVGSNSFTSNSESWLTSQSFGPKRSSCGISIN